MAHVLSLEYCKQHKTKSQPRGWKCICPMCGGHDCWVTPDTGGAFCFECSFKARLDVELAGVVQHSYDLYDVQAIRAVYSEITPLYHTLLSGDALDFVHSRGIDDKMIELFSIGFCPNIMMDVYATDSAKQAGIAHRDTSPVLSGRITFPYIAEHTITDMRGRSLASDDPIRYKSPLNGAVSRGALYPFNYERAIERAKTTGSVIITEGEIKTILADAHGFAALGLPGMGNWRSACVLGADLTPIIIFDSVGDTRSKVITDRAIAKVAVRLTNPHVVCLPLLGEGKMDVDAFLLHPKGGYSRFKTLVDAAIPYDKYKKLRKF